MQQLTRLLLLAALLSGGLVGCGQKSDDGPVPKPGGKRMTLEEAEKLRPKKKGSDN
ncbi:hypothetical protein BH11ARM2_BH11ARM2_37400 [soil metagenome]